MSSVLGDDKDTLSAAVIYTAARLTDFTVIENSIVRGHQGYSSAHLRLSAGPRALAFQSPTCICLSGLPSAASTSRAHDPTRRPPAAASAPQTSSLTSDIDLRLVPSSIVGAACRVVLWSRRASLSSQSRQCPGWSLY